MAHAKIVEMTDDELSAACEDRPWGKTATNIGCGFSLLLGVAIGYAFYRYHGSTLFDSMGGGLLTAIASTFLIHYLMGLRTRRYRSELACRHKIPMIEQAIEKIKSADSPDWIFSLSGRGLPHGDACCVEVCLWLEPELKGTLFRQQKITDYMIGKRPFKIETGNIALSKSDCEMFRSFCSTVSLPNMSDAPAMVMDGFPCTIIALRKQPFGMGQGRCNLSGISQSDADKPVPILAAMLWDTAQAVPIQPSIIGACDFSGNVQIEEL